MSKSDNKDLQSLFNLKGYKPFTPCWRFPL